MLSGWCVELCILIGSGLWEGEEMVMGVIVVIGVGYDVVVYGYC